LFESTVSLQNPGAFLTLGDNVFGETKILLHNSLFWLLKSHW